MKRRKYLKALGSTSVFALATGVSTAEQQRSITAIIPKARVEANDELSDHYKQPFYTLTRTNTDDLGKGVLNRALNSSTHRVDDTLITTAKNGQKRFKPGVVVYRVKFNRGRFNSRLKKNLQNQNSNRLRSDVRSIKEYTQRLEELREEAEQEAEKQIQNSLNSRGNS